MIRPIGPHNEVQKVAEAISEIADSPVLAPYSRGSMMLLLTSSSTAIKPTVQSTMLQPGSTAQASVIGATAAIIGPT